jgi:hypothetical protein
VASAPETRRRGGLNAVERRRSRAAVRHECRDQARLSHESPTSASCCRTLQRAAEPWASLTLIRRTAEAVVATSASPLGISPTPSTYATASGESASAAAGPPAGRHGRRSDARKAAASDGPRTPPHDDPSGSPTGEAAPRTTRSVCPDASASPTAAGGGPCVAEERPTGEHDARRPRYPGAGLQVGPAHLRGGLHLDLDALGDQ